MLPPEQLEHSDPIVSVLRAIALSRTPGFNFPGHFLRLAYERMERREARLALDTSPLSEGADGQMSLGPLALLADMALAASFRSEVGAAARVATVSMGLRLTGAPRVGRLVATARLDGFLERSRERQGLARVEVRSGRKLVATGHGAFIQLGRANATPPHPLPTRGWQRNATLAVNELDAREREVLAHARKCVAGGKPGFVERFWGYRPKGDKDAAECVAWNGPHVGNRVGHAQGGFSLGLAATTACAALPAGWALVGVDAWYVGPGIGEKLTARAEIVHRGLSTAVVRTRIADESGRRVLECASSHVAA